MSRGFKEVQSASKQYTKKVVLYGTESVVAPPTVLPVRADPGSAGYDFSTPVDVTVGPGETKTVWTNVKAYMDFDEVLLLFVRSSIGIKKGIVLANGTGVIDASYYENPSNDGNIGIALKNTTGRTIEFKAGERIAQGIFTKFLVADQDSVLREVREGGTGSSGQ